MEERDLCITVGLSLREGPEFQNGKEEKQKVNLTQENTCTEKNKHHHHKNKQKITKHNTETHHAKPTTTKKKNIVAIKKWIF